MSTDTKYVYANVNIKYSKDDAHVHQYELVKYCNKYGHPRFWLKEGICWTCNQSMEKDLTRLD